MKTRHVVLGITGSIAAYKACDLVSMLRKNEYEVSCVLTKEAARFVAPLALATLSGNRVYEDMFARPDRPEPEHISLAERADVFVVCPASATVIGKLASGIYDDLLTCSVCATRAPVLIAPAMNNNMYGNTVVQGNIARLKKIGYKFIDPVKGRLACGQYAVGHLAGIPEIFGKIKKTLA